MTARHRPDDSFSLKERLNSRKVGGALLLIASVLAFVLANSPLADGYNAVKDFDLAIPWLRIEHMTIGHWAADGVLAIFFFTVGVELKREFVTGSLQNPRKAALPIAAAVGGMAAPAIVYTIIISAEGADALEGWAIPVATDIAFALALLAILGKGLPSSFRSFLLTLAVVDDLLGIIVIAVFYTSGVNFFSLGASLLVVGVYAFCMHKGWNYIWLVLPLGIIAWYFMLQSGVHATIAGVLLGLVVPALPRHGDEISIAEDLEHDWNAISSGFALPVFAFFSAGVPVAVAGGSFVDAITQPVFLAVFFGLVVGKPLGIFTTVGILKNFKLFVLDEHLRMRDILALGCLAGIGFTVSLLIGELAFRNVEELVDFAHLGVIFGSVAAALISVVALRSRVRAHARDAFRDETRETLMP